MIGEAAAIYEFVAVLSGNKWYKPDVGFSPDIRGDARRNVVELIYVINDHPACARRLWLQLAPSPADAIDVVIWILDISRRILLTVRGKSPEMNVARCLSVSAN